MDNIKEEKLIDGLYKLSCDGCRTWYSKLFYTNGLHLCRKCNAKKAIKKFKKKHIDPIVKKLKANKDEVEELFLDLVELKKSKMKSKFNALKAKMEEELEEGLDSVKDELKELLEKLRKG